MSEAIKPEAVRDFLYLDAHRLHSLYSQVFKGVPEQIIQSYGGEKKSSEAASDRLGAGAQVNVEVAEATLRTENRVLLDYMYSSLEQRLAKHIADVTAGTKADTGLSAGQLVRVVGPAKFLDYERLIGFTEKFNRFAEVIALAQITTLGKELEQLHAQAQQVQDRNQRIQAKETLKTLKDPGALAKKMGLAQDEKLLEGIRFTVNMMYPGGFDVLVVPGKEKPRVAFRGILDRKWLRIDPNRLNAAYAGTTEADIIMVGQISRTESKPTEKPLSDVGNTIGDKLQGLFHAISELQLKFDEAGPDRQVITVLPLALYTELALN